MPLTGKYNNTGIETLLQCGLSLQRRTEMLSVDACFLVCKEFFSGACLICGAMHSESDVNLLRCGGCLIVSYCSKDCQRTDWKNHKVLCKKFPLENGKNAIERNIDLVRKDPDGYRDAILEMQKMAHDLLRSRDQMKIKRSGLMLHYHIENLFVSARVCNVCHLARPDMLFDCRCCAVCYCSEEHRLKDEIHWVMNCDELYGCAMANRYLIKHRQLKIPDGLLNEANLNECIDFKKVSKLPQYSNEKWLETIINLVNERLAYPLTIYYALKNLKIGKLKQDLHDITSLTIHIVDVTPMLDPRFWEFFIHQLPKLKTLNLTFMSGLIRLYNTYNTYLPPERCSDCTRKQRVITCDIHYKHYHEYFASDDYEEPDVIAVFNTTSEDLYGMKNIEETHQFMSQRNMTFNKHTVVILSDYMDSYLETCLKVSRKGRPIKVLKPIQKNPVCGFSTHRSSNFVVNVKNFVCCIQGNK